MNEELKTEQSIEAYRLWEKRNEYGRFLLWLKEQKTVLISGDISDLAFLGAQQFIKGE